MLFLIFRFVKFIPVKSSTSASTVLPGRGALSDLNHFSDHGWLMKTLTMVYYFAAVNSNNSLSSCGLTAHSLLKCIVAVLPEL
jgi:hypothetical protein